MAVGLGMLQFGLMYVLYIASYRWLPAWMVALFTIFTPLYVVLFSDLLDRFPRRGTWRPPCWRWWARAWWWPRAMPADADWRGILLLQGANLCFAAGQVLLCPLAAADRRFPRRPSWAGCTWARRCSPWPWCLVRHGRRRPTSGRLGPASLAGCCSTWD